VPVRVSVKIDDRDWNRIMRKLSVPAIQAPLGNVLDDLGGFVQSQIPRRFPKVTPSSMSRFRTGGRFGTFISITEKHAIILNYGGRGKRSRWKAAPKRGKLTRGWYSGILRLKVVKQRAQALMAEAQRAIERHWGS